MMFTLIIVLLWHDKRCVVFTCCRWVQDGVTRCPMGEHCCQNVNTQVQSSYQYHVLSANAIAADTITD